MSNPETNPFVASLAIIQIDEKLSLLRQGWLDATDDKKKNWMSQINAALDERIKLMKVANAEDSFPIVK